MMSKIDTHHLDRTAYIYVRQSTMAQVQHNQESQRRQYGLRERARLLGWQDVTVVDDDLGRSGGGVARPGFDRLLTAVGRGEVGAVFAIEASRLARNGRDWHTLLEFCAIVGALIIDEDGIYDPRSAMVPVVWTGSGKNKLRAGSRRLKVSPFPESNSMALMALVVGIGYRGLL